MDDQRAAIAVFHAVFTQSQQHRRTADVAAQGRNKGSVDHEFQSGTASDPALVRNVRAPVQHVSHDDTYAGAVAPGSSERVGTEALLELRMLRRLAAPIAPSISFKLFRGLVHQSRE